MASKKQMKVNKMTIKCPCSIGDTVYVTKSFYDEDGYFMQHVYEAEVTEIEVVINRDNKPFFQISTRANSYGTWLGDTFPDEESARKSFLKEPD